MGTLFISLLTLVLLLISAFVILIVLMQRTSQSGGMGAALGGGAAESAFGSDTNNMLTKGTIYGIIAFFLVSLGLYLIYQAQAAERVPEVDINTLITGDESGKSAETVGAVGIDVGGDTGGTIDLATEPLSPAAESADEAAEEFIEPLTEPAAQN